MKVPKHPNKVVKNTCQCGKVTVRFNEAHAHLPADEIQKRWPRAVCDDCQTIVYAGNLHYISGDW